MTATASPTSVAAVDYVRAGLSLVAFDHGKKGPERKDWNLRENCISTSDKAKNLHLNIGVAHAYSGTCCLDIDDMPKAIDWFAGAGIDLKALCRDPAAALATSGIKYRLKLFYRRGPGVAPLPTRIFKGEGVELRCGTASNKTVQDVLPPSIHPITGKPYRWLRTKDCWRHMPELPADVLKFWQTLTAPNESSGSGDPVGATDAAIAALLDAKGPDPNDDYDTWLSVGMSLHHETGGGDNGLDLWHRWSKAGKNYKGIGPLESRWRNFDSQRENPRTIHSIEKRAGVTLSMEAEYESLPPPPEPTGTSAPVEKPKFKIETAAEFADCEYEDDFIDGVIPDAAYGVIMGQSGSGKTFAVMDLALAMARGVLWRGRDTRRARVLYVAAEGAIGVRKRMNAYAKHHGIALDSFDLEFLGATPDLTNGNDVRDLIESIKARGLSKNPLGEGRWFTHIVIDTWSQVTPGADENSSKDSGAALKHAEAIHRATGARLIFIAHMGKDMTKGMRGWSGFRAAMDYEIEVSREGQQRALTITKSRDSIDGARFDFHLQQVTIGLTKRGKPVVSCVVIHDMARPKRPPVSKVQTAVMAIVEQYFEANGGAWMPFEIGLQNFKKRMAAKKGRLQPKKDNSRSAVKRALLQLVKNKWLEEKDCNYRPFPITIDL